jgi:hypothetical protein
MSMPKATRTETTFRLEYSVAQPIAAPPERLWALLTRPTEWASWTSTVTSIEGDCRVGQKLKLRVPLSERTFTPKVAELTPHQRMVWSDGAAPMFTGVRTYTLRPTQQGSDFSMTEVFKGVMLPLIKGSLPDFREAFERFAADLEREAVKSG